MAQSLTNQSASKNLSDNVQVSSAGFMESFEQRYPLSALETLLSDHTTGNNIVWADDEYAELGEGYFGDDEIAVESITGLNSGVIKPRTAKEHERQSKRTRNRGEVFTPSWLCNKMNNFLDTEWFGRENVFNTEDGESWIPNIEVINFPKKTGRGWQAYVKSPRLEITCGEAPFICSRYDTSTGETLPVDTRIGFLDRKLRIVSERTQTYETWFKWAYRALKATYGYEYQGDNLVVARINVLETFTEHANNRWGMYPSEEEIEQAANIISWNIWQMNGLTYAVPSNDSEEEVQYKHVQTTQEEDDSQLALFDTTEYQGNETNKVTLCKIYDWDEDKRITFRSLASKKVTDMKKFYAIIGNPPYQEEVEGNGRHAPIYNYFMDESYKISDSVELITPGRFLFNAGQTPTQWNENMLNDAHLKVLEYEPDASLVFNGSEIKGGVVVTLHSMNKTYEPIEVFTKYVDLNSILKKVNKHEDTLRLDSIFAPQGLYRFSDVFFEENRDDHNVQNILESGTKSKIVSSFMEKMPDIFREKKLADGDIKFLGRIKGKREYRYIARKYLQDNKYLDAYKLFIPEANNSGKYGETLAEPIIGNPGEGSADTFLNAGPFKTKLETENLAKYYRTKFFRCLLGVKKVTQHCPTQVWTTIPLQNFTSKSDIDWSKSIPEIDKQLYKKYGLTKKEIDFINSHVQEMD